MPEKSQKADIGGAPLRVFDLSASVVVLAIGLAVSPARVPGQAAGPIPQLDGYRGRAWADAGRSWLARYGGTRWNASRQAWELDSTWPTPGAQVSQQAYYLEQGLRPALADAQRRHDSARLGELAGFFLAYYPRFTTLGQLRGMGSLTRSTALLNGQGPDSTRTLAWVEALPIRDRVRECTLCTSQFLHPAARLVRLIALLPAAERTATMKEFVHVYVPLLVSDHLVRLAYVAEWDYWGARDLPKHLVDIWKALAANPRPVHPSYQHAMLDSDLWLIATAAELLGAEKADPGFVHLGARADSLRQIVQTGVSLFVTKRHEHPETRDFAGRVVGSVSYFDGDFDDHPTMAYVRDTLERFPTPAEKDPAVAGSWDISHASRIPVFLRSLYDAQTATGSDFPTRRELVLATNQYMYRVFHGDFSRPLFRNFFNGDDGWYRVGYSGRKGFGYPPSMYCDMRISNRPCLSDGAVMGWGLLEFVNPDVKKLGLSLFRLAASQAADDRVFKERYYNYGHQPLGFVGADGRETHSFLLFSLTSEFSGSQ